MPPSLMPGAEPIFCWGGDIGCLCLHGLAASPDEVRFLATYLSEQNITVSVPRLAGHGLSDHRLLQHIRWQDWYLGALDAYHTLKSNCKTLYVVGHSMGSLLTFLLASEVTTDGIIAIAPPLKLPNTRTLAMSRWIKLIRPFAHMPDKTDFPQRLVEEKRRRGEVPAGRIRYDIWPTQSIEELYKLMQLVDAKLPIITTPTLLIFSEADQTVPLYNRDYIHNRLGSSHVQSNTLKKSGHIITQDYEYEHVQKIIYQFIVVGQCRLADFNRRSS